MEDKKIEDEKSVGLLSSKSVESQNIVLPKDIFRNSFTWFCYETYKSLAFRIWLILWLPLTAWWKVSSEWIYPFLATLFLVEVLFFLPLILIIGRKRAISKQYTQFCKEIINHAPGTDDEDWEPVLINFNSYMYENKLWKTEHMFFDCSSFRESFRIFILEPFCLKKDNDAKVKSFKESVPYIEEALQVYFARVDELWNQVCSEKSLSAIDSKDTPLPKQLYRFKAVWTFKTALNNGALGAIIPYLYCIFVSWRYNIFVRVFYLGFMLFVLIAYFKNVRVAPMKLEHKMHYISTVISEQEVGANGWDQIAKKMNVYLFEQKVCKSQEFFFDGTDCKWFFDHNFSSSLSSKKSMWLLPLNAELWPYIKEAQSACGEESLA